MRQSMRIDDALTNTGWTVKTDARQRGQLRVHPRMETTVDPVRNDVWTALTMAALTARMNATPQLNRGWGQMKIPTDSHLINGMEIDGLRIMEDAQRQNTHLELGNRRCLRKLHFRRQDTGNQHQQQQQTDPLYDRHTP